MSDEKTEEATEKKLDDAKKKGQNAKSQDVTAAVSLLSMTICLTSASTFAIERLMAVVSRLLDGVGDVDGLSPVLPQLEATAVDALLPVVVFTALAILAGIVGTAAQVGLNISFEPIEPKFDKINPGNGLKKLVSIKSLVEFVKTIVKALALAAVLWNLLQAMLPILMGSPYLTPAAIASLGWSMTLRLLGGAVIVFFVVGPLDFALQKVMFLRDQRMSKDEIKREHKESEGDPQLKGQRKQLAREMANSPPSKAVPGASVVVTNPTHYAVALRYVEGETAVPVVVAKGVDAEALLIRRIAEENRIPIVADPPLARALYTLPLSAQVPERMFEAVAAILRWVALVKSSGS